MLKRIKFWMYEHPLTMLGLVILTIALAVTITFDAVAYYLRVEFSLQATHLVDFVGQSFTALGCILLIFELVVVPVLTICKQTHKD